MAYDFSALKARVEETKNWLSKEYTGIRTGRATPVLLDSVRVEAYGSKMPVNQVATVTIEDAKTLRIAPWDAGQIQSIEKAIINADLGISVSVDDKGVRISFPELTGERREMLKKLLRDKLEQGRVALRSARDDVWSEIQKKEKDGEISEDEKFRAKDDMQKLIDEGNKSLEDTSKRKEEEIMN